MTVVTDNFNRPDNPSLGVGWTPLSTGGFTISGNEAMATINDHVGNFRNAETYTDYQYAQVALTSTLPLAYHDFLGCMVRTTNGGNDFYTIFYFNNNAVPGNEELWLYKRVAGGFAGAGGGFLMAGTGTYAAGTLSPGDVLRIEARGPIITGYINGVRRVAGWDTDHPGGGTPGIFGFGFTGTKTIDNYDGGDLSITYAPTTVSDDFNRANGADFGGSANWQKVDNSLAPSVTSNAILGTASTTVRGAWAGNFGNDQTSQITGLNVPGGSWMGVTVRSMAPVAVSYLAIAYNPGTPVVNLYKEIGLNIFTQLGSSYTIPGGTISSSDVLRIEATGSTITAKYNGITAVSVTDTQIPGGGAPGVAIFDVASGDNWQGTYVGGAPTPDIPPVFAYMAPTFPR